MASTMRYRSGVMNLVALKTHASYPIEDGDLVYEVSGIAYPASAQADGGNEAANQLSFAETFAGVAMAKTGLQSGETSFRLTTDPGYTLVATTGDFEFPCPSTSFSPGDLIGADENADGDALLDQQVALVTLVNSAIGVAKVPYNALGDAQTSILVSLRSALTRESVSGN